MFHVTVLCLSSS